MRISGSAGTSHSIPPDPSTRRRRNIPKHRRCRAKHLVTTMAYSHPVRLALAATLVLAAASPRAQADGIAVIGGSPRAIGRAGVGTVSDDGGGALLINPAAMARRDTRRFELGAGFVDDSLAWRRASTVPVARDQAGSSI